jgi:ribosomal protein S19
VSRVTWKFLPFSNNDLKCYYSTIDEDYKLLIDHSRSRTLNNFTTPRTFYVHQGWTYVEVNSDEFYLRRKLGMFAKTRRPYFFRSKKKR